MIDDIIIIIIAIVVVVTILIERKPGRNAGEIGVQSCALSSAAWAW